MNLAMSSTFLYNIIYRTDQYISGTCARKVKMHLMTKTVNHNETEKLLMYYFGKLRQERPKLKKKKRKKLHESFT